MADGFDVRIEGEQALRIRTAAEAAGVDPLDYTRVLIDQSLKNPFAEDDRRWAEYLRTGETVSIDEAFAAFDAAVERVRTRKAG